MKNSETNHMEAESFGTQVNQLAATILRQLHQQHKGSNYVFSPLSIYVLLSMAADATDERTKRNSLMAYYETTSCPKVENMV